MEGNKHIQTHPHARCTYAAHAYGALCLAYVKITVVSILSSCSRVCLVYGLATPCMAFFDRLNQLLCFIFSHISAIAQSAMWNFFQILIFLVFIARLCSRHNFDCDIYSKRYDMALLRATSVKLSSLLHLNAVDVVCERAGALQFVSFSLNYDQMFSNKFLSNNWHVSDQVSVSSQNLCFFPFTMPLLLLVFFLLFRTSSFSTTMILHQADVYCVTIFIWGCLFFRCHFKCVHEIRAMQI